MKKHENLILLVLVVLIAAVPLVGSPWHVSLGALAGVTVAAAMPAVARR